MREVVQKVYKFNELKKKVQEEVLKRERYTWVDGLDWSAYMLEDFEDTMYADHFFRVDEDGVSFSLYNAGAGAGFTGEFETAQAAINVALAFDMRGDVNMELNCELNNGVKVKTYKAAGASYCTVWLK